MADKSSYWWSVLYPENMIKTWQDDIGDLLQLPFAYCIHNADKDSKGDKRKEHVHMIIAWSNPTTYNHALNTFNSLSVEGKKATNTCQIIKKMRHAYDYLIHDTEECRKKNKKLYPPEARITGNNFDIGAFEQLSTAERSAMRRELANICLQGGFTNYASFYAYVCKTLSTEQVDIVIDYNAFFERLTRGIYHETSRKS